VSHQILAAAASKLAGPAVRLVPSREGVYRLSAAARRRCSGWRWCGPTTGRLDALIHSGVVA